MGSGGKGHKFWCDKCQCYADFSDFETCESVCGYCEARKNKARVKTAEAEVERLRAELAAMPRPEARAEAAEAEVARLCAELAQARADAEATRVAAARDRDRMRGNVDAWRDRTGTAEAEVARLRTEAEHLRVLLSEGVEIVDSLSAGYGVWTEAAGRALGGAR